MTTYFEVTRKFLNHVPLEQILQSISPQHHNFNHLLRPRSQESILMFLSDSQELWSLYGLNLLEHNLCDARIMDNDQDTILDHALCMNNEQAILDVTHFIIRSFGPDVSKELFLNHKSQSNMEEYPLTYAVQSCENGNNVVRHLLSLGAEIQYSSTITNVLGLTLLRGKTDIFETLILELRDTQRYSEEAVNHLLNFRAAITYHDTKKYSVMDILQSPELFAEPHACHVLQRMVSHVLQVRHEHEHVEDMMMGLDICSFNMQGA